MDSPPPAKAEAVAAAVTAPPGKPEKATTKAARPTTLLDVQEVEWITRELERLLAREQSGDASSADGRHRRKRARLSRPAPAAHKGSFLADLLGRHAVSICSGDAVDHSSAAGDRGRRRGFREVEKV